MKCVQHLNFIRSMKEFTAACNRGKRGKVFDQLLTSIRQKSIIMIRSNANDGDGILQVQNLSFEDSIDIFEDSIDILEHYYRTCKKNGMHVHTSTY